MCAVVSACVQRSGWDRRSKQEKPIAVSGVCGHNQRHTVEIICVFAVGAVLSFSGPVQQLVNRERETGCTWESDGWFYDGMKCTWL